jgi:hypothetical protein
MVTRGLNEHVGVRVARDTSRYRWILANLPHTYQLPRFLQPGLSHRLDCRCDADYINIFVSLTALALLTRLIIVVESSCLSAPSDTLVSALVISQSSDDANKLADEQELEGPDILPFQVLSDRARRLSYVGVA